MAYMKDAVGRRLDDYPSANPHLYNFTGPKFRYWNRALAGVRNGDADASLLCVGDSTTAGAKASTTATFVGKRAYPARLAEMLNSYVVPAARGLVTPIGTSNAIASDSRWTVGSGWTQNGDTTPYIGFGGKGAYYYSLGVSAGNLVFQDPDVLADTFDVYYEQRPGSGSLGTFDVTATGGSTSNVNTAATGGAPRVSKATVTAASAATTNSVTIAGKTAAKFVNIIGVVPRLSTTKKVLVHNAGISGSTTLDWVTYASNLSTNDYNGLGSIKALTPALTIIDLGINDANALSATVSDYITRLQQVIAAAQVSGDVILKTMLPSTGTGVAALEDQYVAAALQLGLPVIDFYGRVKPNASYFANGMMNVDGLHGTDYGYLDVADFVRKALAVI